MVTTSLSLAGKVALITGGARGQGADEARLFAAHGAHVFVADILDDEGRALTASIDGARFIHLDVADEQAWAAAIATVVDGAGGLDILVNNAGITHFAPLHQTALADFERLIRVNLISAFLGMRAALAPMQSRGGGSIVNVSSIAGLTGRSNLSAYGSTKWAMRGLSRSAAMEFGPFGIRVNTILPGLIATPMTVDAYGEDLIENRGSTLPLGRAGQPRDIANMALFLASDASAFCSGGEFLCDGGQLAGV